MADTKPSYFVPKPSAWPLTASLGMFLSMVGGVNWMHDHPSGHYLFLIGLTIITFTMFGWFGAVIRESEAGLYDEQVDRTFRWSMFWFIFSEVCFFAAFFGALFYTRVITVPHLGGMAFSDLTHYVLWPNFKAGWPLFQNPDQSMFVAPKSVIPAWGLPAVNTAILLTSGVTVTWAHWALKKNNRSQLVVGLLLTVLLGIAFLYLQSHEYIEAYHEHGLTLASGIYGSTFFMLTGFHGAHVTIGTIMLIVIMFRSMKGHFTPENHFAFEAVSWYWHFVDVVWLGLFIFVYWL